jgi:hypothetical protein
MCLKFRTVRVIHCVQALCQGVSVVANSPYQTPGQVACAVIHRNSKKQQKSAMHGTRVTCALHAECRYETSLAIPYCCLCKRCTHQKHMYVLSDKLASYPTRHGT